MRKTLAAMLMIGSFGAQAEWKQVSSSINGDNFYIDFSTIRKSQYGYRAWEITDYKKPSIFGARSAKALKEYDCGEDRERVLQASFHVGQMGAGETTSIVNTYKSWTYVSPGSVNKAILKAVCEQKRH